MSFGELVLDDRTFQSLVDEARRRISEKCPEWSEHNVSDPGITLIETFAWMTEQLIYRLNRVPEKLHLALLDLLQIELAPPSAAEVDLLFRLAGPIEDPLTIPARETEVNVPGLADETHVFRVVKDFTIPCAKPSTLKLKRANTWTTLTVKNGVAHPTGDDEDAFSFPPRIGDAIYLGFRDSLAQLLMRVEVKGHQARGRGIEPQSPPLLWEASAGGEWLAVEVHEDTTAGFNQLGGTITLQIPPRTAVGIVDNVHRHWLRCRLTELTPAGKPSPRFTHPPRIESISAGPVGALLRAEQAMVIDGETLGDSDASPGQRFKVRRTPAMELREGETLEVCDPEDGRWKRWDLVDSFDESDMDDTHFRFHPAVGEVELGPSIHTRKQGWKQRGAIPTKGSRLRMTRYRYGGGAGGAVEANALSQLRNPIPGIGSVTNPLPATGGVDGEPLDRARDRAALELRTRYRAVTAEDYAFLACEDTVDVARACCLPPGPGEAVPVYILPAVVGPERFMTFEQLTAGEELLESVRTFLDLKRMVGTSVHVMPVPLRAVTVVTDVAIRRSAHALEVKQDIKHALECFINPLIGGGARDGCEGWGFGRPLNEGELYSLVQDVDGVDRVRTVRMYETDLRTPGAPSRTPAGAQITIKPCEVLCSATHRVRVGGSDED